MSTRETKEKRKAAAEITGDEAVRRGLLPDYYWLRDPVDEGFAEYGDWLHNTAEGQRAKKFRAKVDAAKREAPRR